MLKIAFWRNKMQYIKLKELLKDFTIFSITDIKKVDNSFHRRRLNEWQDKGYIKKIIRGWYIFSDLELNENILFEIANRIYNPSYISFEMALSYYHLIPESVYQITSASTRRTYRFKTPISDFSYRTIKPKFFFGYDLVRHKNKCFKIASIEKTLLDFFYITPHLNDETAYANLRINKDILFNQINKEKLHKFLDKYSQKILSKRIITFWEYIKNA